MSAQHKLAAVGRWVQVGPSRGARIIAEVYGVPDADALARQFAAAPDLLAALRQSLAAMEHMGEVLNNMDAVGDDDVAHFDAFDAARAAIARAEGREP